MDIVKGSKIPFRSKLFQSKIPFQLIVSREEKEVVKLEVKEMLKKEAIRKVQPSKGEYVSNLFLVIKKDGGTKTSDEFEATECIYPILPLQNGRFAKSEIHVAKRRLHVQTRLKRLFFSSLRKKFKAICLLSLVRKLVRVSLLLLWFGTSTTNIHKITKSANDSLTQDKHQNNNLLRRHAIDWSLIRRVFMSPDTVIFLLQHLGIVINRKKSVLTPAQEIQILALTINSVTLELSLNKKNLENSFRMSEFVKQSTDINSGVDKVDWLVDINYSSRFTSKVELSFPSNTTNITFIGKPFLLGKKNCFERNLKN